MVNGRYHNWPEPRTISLIYTVTFACVPPTSRARTAGGWSRHFDRGAKRGIGIFRSGSIWCPDYLLIHISKKSLESVARCFTIHCLRTIWYFSGNPRGYLKFRNSRQILAITFFSERARYIRRSFLPTYEKLNIWLIARGSLYNAKTKARRS